MTRVLFLDIDGVLLPGRAYALPNQTNNPYVTVFDPCAVAMLNEALRKHGHRCILQAGSEIIYDHEGTLLPCGARLVIVSEEKPHLE